MTYSDRVVKFELQGDTLFGVVTLPDTLSVSRGVLVIVGGPQYRVGSHRQFVLLSRSLATRGIPCMRFDYRGMGDASGGPRDFDAIEDDIRAAIDCFVKELPELEHIVLWALCDAASASCFYAAKDERIAGLVLLNPWVRTEAGEARTYVKAYYAKRIIDPAFWRKLLGGELSIGRSIREFLGAVWKSRSSGASRSLRSAAAHQDLPSRMAAGLRDAQLPMLFILSGRDFVANEFDDAVRDNPVWSELLEMAEVWRLAPADHTFARHEWREAVSKETARWVSALDAQVAACPPTQETSGMSD